MTEQTKPSESQFGKDWIMFGQKPGLKTEDLLLFDKTKPQNVRVLPGISVGASLFSDFVVQNGFSKDSSDLEVELGQLPRSLDDVNSQIVDQFKPKKPIIVRSSATDERGGSGIYDSIFFVPTGDRDKDLRKLTSAEKQVYTSYFRKEAKLYRDGEFSNEGMGLLLHPVIGKTYGNYFMPVLSGVFTVIDGKICIKVVPGLGTRAVSLDEEYVMWDDPNPFMPFKLRKQDAINLKTGEIEQISINSLLVQNQFENMLKLQNAFYSWREAYSKGQSSYQEFAISDSENLAVVTQSASESQQPFDLKFEPPEGKILFEAKDVANIGIRRGRGILALFVDAHQVPVDMSNLPDFNLTHRNFLLMLPDISLSSTTEGLCQLQFPHYSNAAGIIELQYENDNNDQWGVNHKGTIPGGTHFLELCKRKRILFLGVEADKCQPLLDIKHEVWGNYSLYWDVEFKVTNTKGIGRVEILDSPT